LNTSGIAGKMKLRWLPILRAKWSEPTTLTVQKQLRLSCPEKGHWFALVKIEK